MNSGVEILDKRFKRAHPWFWFLPTERLDYQVPRSADVVRADHHRHGRPGFYRLGVPGGGRGPQAEEQPVQGKLTVEETDRCSNQSPCWCLELAQISFCQRGKENNHPPLFF